MSGKKGMKHYPKEIKEVIIREHQRGVSVTSLSREYGVSRYAIQCWCGLRPEKNIRDLNPKLRGRPPKGYVPSEQDKDREIKRLRMENELLRSFLQIAGRR